MLGIVKEVLVDAISALLEGHLEAQEYVDNMAVRGRYDEQISIEFSHFQSDPFFGM